MVQADDCFYLKLRLSDSELRMVMPPVKLRLKVQSSAEAEQYVRRFQCIFDALAEFVAGKPAPYGLPPDMHQYVEEMPGIFNWALEAVPGLIRAWTDPQN
jgi:hypothetical protein